MNKHFTDAEERRSAQSILKIIHDVFGDSESLSALQEMFFKRSQKADETLHEYSLSLMQLHDKIQKKSLETGITSYDTDAEANMKLREVNT